MKLYRAILVAVALAPTACSSDAPPDIERGLRFLADGRVEDAQQYFDSLQVNHPSDLDVRAWTAHALFAQRQFDDAVARAREVLISDPCHAVAHRVIGASLNPQYQWDRADDEESWAHLSEAQRCDPTDAFTWVEAIVPAMRHGEHEVEDAVLRSLVEQQALPVGAVAFGRWLLAEVPERAILITMGDLDTFPAWGLQRTERLRPDVAVVNVNLLSAWWYGSQVRDRFDLPLPTADPASYSMESTLAHWWTLSERGTLGRPLVVAPTVPGELIPGGPESLQLASTYRTISSQGAASTLESALASIDSFTSLSGADFRSSDRAMPGPFRTAAGNVFAPLVLNLALRHAETLAESGRLSETQRLADWAETFADGAGLTGDQKASVTAMQALTQEGLR